MNPMNINEYRRGDVRGSNYRLLNEPMGLKVRMEHIPSKEECAWEDDGGPTIPLVVDMTVEEYHKQQMRIRGARKQRAARAYRPIESIKVVKQAEPRTPRQIEDVEVRQDVQVAQLEGRIRELIGLVDKEKRRKEAIDKLAEHFNVVRKTTVVK